MNWRLRWYKQRIAERVGIFFAWKLPKFILKWALVRAAVKAAGDDKNPGEVTYQQMYKAI